MPRSCAWGIWGVVFARDSNHPVPNREYSFPGALLSTFPTGGATNEEDLFASMPCVPGVEYRAGTGENQRSVEVRQTFRSAQHSGWRQAGPRINDRADQR